MPSRQEVIAAAGQEHDYVAAGRVLGIPSGRAYLIATGTPADGGQGGPEGEDRGAPPTSTQYLAHGQAQVVNPTVNEPVLEWVKRRAATDSTMQAAAGRRDVAVRPPGVEEDTEISSLLTRQHDRLMALVAELSVSAGLGRGPAVEQLRRRRAIVAVIAEALSGHEATEEEHFWPAVRQDLPDGPERCDTARSQEKEIRELIAGLGCLSPDRPEFDERVGQLVVALRQHVAFEDRVLVDLEGVTDGEPRAELGRRVRRGEEHSGEQE